MSESLIIERKSEPTPRERRQVAAAYRGRQPIRPTSKAAIAIMSEPVPVEVPLMTAEGVVKVFDALKGYGFVVTEQGDVFLHICCVRDAGREVLYPGTLVRCEVERKPKGLAARRILELDESQAIKRLVNSNVVRTETIGGWEKAWLRSFNRERKFGFFTRGFGTPDLFIHLSVLERTGFVDLQLFQQVEVRHGLTLRGRSDVVDIRLVGTV